MNRFRKKLFVLAALTTGTLFQLVNTGGGCLQFGAQIGLTTFDFCAVLNCEQGAFFNFCDPIVLLLDCL